jgi:hypothetical protein
VRGYFGFWMIVLVSIAFAGKGIYLLVILKKYLILIVCVVLVIGYPLFLYLLFTTELFKFLKEMPEWLAILFGVVIASISPCFILSGFIINGIAEDKEEAMNAKRRKEDNIGF